MNNPSTPRVITDSSGAVKARHDYLPFGEEIGLVGGRSESQKYVMDNVKQKFTGYERDGETGLDYAQARYYASAQGRFTSVDPIKLKRTRLLDPQRINLYSYCRNNPLNYIDPNGADLVLAAGLKPKQRDYIVKNLARLYMTKSGRAEIEKANSSRIVGTVGMAELERRSLSTAPPASYVVGGQERVVGGDTLVPFRVIDGKKVIAAQEVGQPASPNYPPIVIRMDKDNTETMGKDPAIVGMHELRHFNNAVDEANKPLPGYPDYPSNDISGLDKKKDEDNARQAEKEVEGLPDEASPESIKAIENILKSRDQEKQP